MARVAQLGESTRQLSEKNQRLIQGSIDPGEAVEFFLVGASDQAIVALKDRCLVLKSGFLAGSTFGGRATSFYYPDITSIEVNTGMMNGVIEICTAGHQGSTQKDYWSSDKNSDPFKVSNCIPIAKAQLPAFEPYLKRLRDKINASKQVSAQAAATADLTVQLEKLGELKAAGVISEDEFTQAKRRLLGL